MTSETSVTALEGSTDNPSLSRFVEVCEAHSARRATEFLKRGYDLISILHAAKPAQMPGEHEKRPQYYVRRFAIFVVGRTADVPEYDPEAV